MHWIDFMIIAFIVFLCCLCCYKCYTAQERERPVNYPRKESSRQYQSHSCASNWPDYKSLVRKLVEKFKDQRERGSYEFAVLVLSQEEIATIEKTSFWLRNGALTNRIYSTYPSDYFLGNFIVSRPDGRHAEVLLMNRFNSLWARQSHYCKTILLYSWLLPCNSCARRIADVLGPYAGERKTIVLYTSANGQEEEEKESRRLLNIKNIMMVKVKYYSFIPPG